MPVDTFDRTARQTQSIPRPPHLFTEADHLKFWSFVFKTPTCWLWEGCRSSAGYGVVSVAGKVMYTHRLSWILHNGPIPKGLFILHNCPAGDQPACINPAHLSANTAWANTQDALKKGRLNAQAMTLQRLWRTCWKDRRGQNVTTHKLTDEQVLEIRRLHREEGWGHKRLHKAFPVSYGVIQRILNHTAWRHLP
jgi:hypothetical protein